jgi:hypothetical protein
MLLLLLRSRSEFSAEVDIFLGRSWVWKMSWKKSSTAEPAEELRRNRVMYTLSPSSFSSCFSSTIGFRVSAVLFGSFICTSLLSLLVVVSALKILMGTS